MNRILPGGDVILDKEQVRKKLGISQHRMNTLERMGVMTPMVVLPNSTKPHYSKFQVERIAIEIKKANAEAKEN